MFTELVKVPATVWAQYTFQKDILRDKLSDTQKQEIAEKAISCGKSEAEKLLIIDREITPLELVREKGIEFSYMPEEKIGDRVMFALYTSPNLIQISEEPIKKVANLNLPGLTEDKIKDLLLSHELFHYIETHDETIYTQKTQITLWKFLFYTHKSQVRTLSEIAAMSFAETMNNLPYSPFLLDILLIHAYDPTAAKKMYNEVMDLYQTSL